jgi:hypothetical protein
MDDGKEPVGIAERCQQRPGGVQAELDGGDAGKEEVERFLVAEGHRVAVQVHWGIAGLPLKIAVTNWPALLERCE